MLMLILIGVAATFLFYYFIVKPFSYWKERGVKQGNPIWIFGDSWGVFTRKKNLADMVQTVYNISPNARYTGAYQFFVPTLVVKDPELIKQIAIRDFDHFTDHKLIFPEDVDPLWGKNLFTQKGKTWRDMRTLLSPSFTSSKMRAMFVLILECAEDFVQHFLRKNEEVVTIELKDTFTRFTNDVIASTAFGFKVDSLGEPNNQFYLMGTEATSFNGFWKNIKFFGYLLVPRLFKLLKVPFFSKKDADFFQEMVSETIKAREEKGIVRPDMINLLLEARRGVQKPEEDNIIDTGFSTAQDINLGKPAKLSKDITDLDITAQSMSFFFAGFDSVVGEMNFLGYELAINPEIQDRLRQEVISTLEECDGKLTYEALLNMKYMDMVVSEALRKWFTSIATDRICTKPYTIEATRPDEVPIHLEKDDVVWLPTFAIHRDPAYFPDPERFDPERFNDQNKVKIKSGTYFPFGLGPRNCLGSRLALLEIKTVFFYILKHFELVPVEKSTIPVRLSKKDFGLASADGFWFGLKRINA